jgi:hypothetical protein
MAGCAAVIPQSRYGIEQAQLVGEEGLCHIAAHHTNPQVLVNIPGLFL